MWFVLMIVISLHTLAGVFWAGSTFATHGKAMRFGPRLAYSQLGAAFVAIVAGGAMWGLTQPYGEVATILGIGAACAIVAVALQAATLPALRQAARAGEGAPLRRWTVVSQRFAAGLLAVTVVCMVIWRFA